MNEENDIIFGYKVNSEENQIMKKRSYTVVKSNILIQNARFQLSLFEQKLLVYIIAQIKPDDTELKRYTISIKEFCRVCGIDYKNGGNYAYIKKTIEKMAQRFMWINISENNVQKETMIRIIERPYISKQSGTIEIKLDEVMQEYLLFLKNTGNFTIYDAIFSLPMTSSYSMRFYELFKSYANQGIIRISVKKLREILMLDKKSYDRWSNLKSRILDVAISEINEKTDIDVRYKTSRKERKIDYITFLITNKGTDDTLLIWKQNQKILNKEIDNDNDDL